MQSENKCQDVMSSQGLQLSSLCQLSLGLSFLKSCLFDRTLSPQICHFSLQARLEQKLSVFWFAARFSSFYLDSKGQGTSMTWINRLAAGDHKAAAPPEGSPSRRRGRCASVLYRRAARCRLWLWFPYSWCNLHVPNWLCCYSRLGLAVLEPCKQDVFF